VVAAHFSGCHGLLSGDEAGGLDHWLFLACLFVETLVRLQNLHHARRHRVLGRRIFDIGPQVQIGVSSDFIVVRTDVKAPSLTSSNRLRQAKQRCSKCSNAVLEKDRASVHGRSSARNLDAETIVGDSNLLELASIAAGVCNYLVGVVGVEGGGLEEDSALDVVDVCLAEEDGDSVQNSLPSLVFVLLHSLQEHLSVLGNGHLLVDEKLVAGLVMRLEGEAFGKCRVHGIDIDIQLLLQLLEPGDGFNASHDV